jgi:hypothetical protein
MNSFVKVDAMQVFQSGNCIPIFILLQYNTTSMQRFDLYTYKVGGTSPRGLGVGETKQYKEHLPATVKG